MSFGKYMYVGGFIQKIALRTTIIHSKQANRRQQVIQPTKIEKDNSKRFQKTPHRSLGLTATKVGWPTEPKGRPASLPRSPLALCCLVLIPQIYTADFKVVLGRFIQR